MSYTQLHTYMQPPHFPCSCSQSSHYQMGAISPVFAGGNNVRMSDLTARSARAAAKVCTMIC